MKPKRIYINYLNDMVSSAEKALEFVAGMNGDEFLRDEKTVFAVIRALEILGEAAKKIPNEKGIISRGRGKAALRRRTPKNEKRRRDAALQRREEKSSWTFPPTPLSWLPTGAT